MAARLSGAKVKITQTKLLLVEGKDEELFFSAALEKHTHVDDIQVLPIAGKTRLRENLASLKRDANFPGVTSLAVIRDADDSFASAFQSVRDSLMHHKLPVPREHGQFTTGVLRVGVFIMPDGKNNGMLETLCMRSVKGRAQTACVESYLDCLKQNGAYPAPVDKARAHAWLAGQDDPEKRVGEAAQAGYWPFADSAFDNLWNFIRAM
ncbi:MAG: DUF3226 domain-containing protein [Phycisphaerae bacterium]